MVNKEDKVYESEKEHEFTTDLSKNHFYITKFFFSSASLTLVKESKK